MAGPIRISILADAAQAVKSVTKFSEVVDSETRRVVTTLGDSKLQGGFGKVQEGFDVMDTRAMGFRDTLTGIQDTQRGFAALTTSTGEATAKVAAAQAKYNEAVKTYGVNSAQAAEAQSELSLAQQALAQQQAPMIDKLFLLGTGVGDLASGFANFIVPMAAVVTTMNGLSLASARATVAMAGQKVAMVAGAVATGAMTAAQWLLNIALTANPIGIVIVLIVALVAAIVVAYKRSETFRKIVDASLRAVGAGFQWVWDKGRQFLSWLTQMPGHVRGAFSGAGGWLLDAGGNIIDGLIGGVQRGFDRVQAKFRELTNLIPDWKGPASRDKRLLDEPADLIMGGFADRLESRFGGVRATLSRFTGGLATAAAGSATAPVGAAPATGGGTMRLVADGSSTGAAALIVALIEDESRKRGGLRIRALA
jgi:phage-related protein